MARSIPLPFIGPPPDRNTYVDGHVTDFGPARWKQALDRMDPCWWPESLGQVNGRLHRRDVFQLQHGAGQPAGAAHLFAASAIWGSGNRRISFRMKACEAGFDLVANVLAQAAAQVRVDDPADVFGALECGPLDIKHLGPSYFTKFMYFAGYRADGAGRRPLIFDERVRRAVLKLCGLKLGSSRGDYDSYLNLTHDGEAMENRARCCRASTVHRRLSPQLAIEVLLGRPPGQTILNPSNQDMRTVLGSSRFPSWTSWKNRTFSPCQRIRFLWYPLSYLEFCRARRLSGS